MAHREPIIREGFCEGAEDHQNEVTEQNTQGAKASERQH